MYLVAVDETTEEATVGSDLPFLYGENYTSGKSLRVDQGIDSAAISRKFKLETDLVETQYIIEIDNRLGTIVSQTGPAASIAYIDDDNIASYRLTLGTDNSYVSTNSSTAVAGEVIAGPRGTTLKFSLQSSIELNSSVYLFDQIGSGATTTTFAGATGTFQFIDTTVRIQGATTGAQIDLPVRFIKSA